MIKKISLSVLFTFILFCTGYSDSNPRAIVEKAQNTVKLRGAEAISTLTIFDSKGNRRVRNTAQITKLYDNGKTEKKLIRFLSPADVKGTGFLTFDYENRDDDMWLYLPALRKTRRIISSEKSKNFMGSEFSYSDMSFPSIDDFNYKSVGTETAGDEKCWKIEILPKDDDRADEYGFSKKTVWIAKKDNVIRKAVYYDLTGELHKKLTVKNIRLIDTAGEKYRAMHMTMINIQNNRKSILEVQKIKFNPHVKNSYFSSRYLERY